MHVLVLPSWYKTTKDNIVGSFFEEQARAIISAGIKVGIFYPSIDLDYRLSAQEPLRETMDFIDNGLPTYSCSVRSIVPRSRALNYKFLQTSSVNHFKKYCSDYGTPDLIHAHCVFSAGIVANHFFKNFNIPYIITEHYTGLIISNISKYAFNRKIIRKVYSESVSNIVVSNSFSSDLCSKYDLPHDTFHVLPNMVNSLFFREAGRLCESAETGEFRIFTNSLLTEKKNHRLLLSSFSEALKVFPRLKLVIGGDGELKRDLMLFTGELGVEENVCFLGVLTREEVRRQILKSDLFVSTSSYETFGIAIAEALACGKPVVATNSGGPADILTPSDGILVQRHTVKDVADAIIYMIQNIKDYNPDDISLRCKERFGEKNVIDQLVAMYNTCLEIK